MPEILRGEVGAVSLPSIIQLVEAEAISGWLELHDRGRIGFRGGMPVAGEADGYTGIEAVLELFIEPSSSFSLEVATGVDGDSIGSPLGLIMEGCRLADEWKRIAPLVLVPTGGGTNIENPALEKLLRALDGSVSVYRAIQRARVPRSRIIDDVLQMQDEGSLHEVTQPPSPRRTMGPAPKDFNSAMQAGRKALRAGEFDEAERAFQHALSLQPDDRIAQQNLRRVKQVRGGASSPFSSWFKRA